MWKRDEAVKPPSSQSPLSQAVAQSSPTASEPPKQTEAAPATRPCKIFLSYRRDDTAAIVGRVYDRLQAKFGRDAVFMDIDAVPLGADFRLHISSAVAQCDALLVVMGERWASASAGDRRRLEDPADFVRIEIEAALAHELVVIPVLVGSATMPQSDVLPGRLADLAYRNAASLDVGKDFNSHMDRLLRALESLLGARAARLPNRSAGPQPAATAKPDGNANMGSPTLSSPEAVASLVEESLREVKVETGSGMGGSWINSANLHQVWRRLNERMQGEEIPPLCRVLQEIRSFEIHWVAINCLEFSAQLVDDVPLHRMILSAVRDHLPKGGHLQSAAISLLQSLHLLPEDLFEPLLSAARLTRPDQACDVLEALSRVTPLNRAEAATVTAVRVLSKLPVNSYSGKRMVDIIRQLGHRGAAANLRQAMRGQSHQTIGAIATLLADWKDEKAVTQIREYIDLQHSSANQLYILDTLCALYRLEGPSCCRYIADILPHCHPYVQRYLNKEHLGELLHEPMIVDAISGIYDSTRDPEIKSGLAPVVERAR